MLESEAADAWLDIQKYQQDLDSLAARLLKLEKDKLQLMNSLEEERHDTRELLSSTDSAWLRYNSQDIERYQAHSQVRELSLRRHLQNEIKAKVER